MSTSTLAFFAPSPGELLLIVGIILLLFGKRLPGAMKSLGKSVVEFKKGIKTGKEEGGASESKIDQDNTTS